MLRISGYGSERKARTPEIRPSISRPSTSLRLTSKPDLSAFGRENAHISILYVAFGDHKKPYLPLMMLKNIYAFELNRTGTRNFVV